MRNIYGGNFEERQMDREKKILHAKIHWLLIYKEEDYSGLDGYFESVLTYISSLNDLLGHPQALVDLMVTLQQARSLSQSGYDHAKYRKLILDAHSKLDALMEAPDGDVQ